MCPFLAFCALWVLIRLHLVSIRIFLLCYCECIEVGELPFRLPNNLLFLHRLGLRYHAQRFFYCALGGCSLDIRCFWDTNLRIICSIATLGVSHVRGVSFWLRLHSCFFSLYSPKLHMHTHALTLIWCFTPSSSVNACEFVCAVAHSSLGRKSQAIISQDSVCVI